MQELSWDALSPPLMICQSEVEDQGFQHHHLLPGIALSGIFKSFHGILSIITHKGPKSAYRFEYIHEVIPLDASKKECLH